MVLTRSDHAFTRYTLNLKVFIQFLRCVSDVGVLYAGRKPRIMKQEGFQEALTKHNGTKPK